MSGRIRWPSDRAVQIGRVQVVQRVGEATEIGGYLRLRTVEVEGGRWRGAILRGLSAQVNLVVQCDLIAERKVTEIRRLL